MKSQTIIIIVVDISVTLLLTITNAASPGHYWGAHRIDFGRCGTVFTITCIVDMKLGYAVGKYADH